MTRRNVGLAVGLAKLLVVASVKSIEHHPVLKVWGGIDPRRGVLLQSLPRDLEI